MKFAIIDVETTGLGGSGQKITEIAIVVHDGKKIIDEYQTLVNPQSLITNYVVSLTGIDNDMVATAPTFKEIAQEVLRVTTDCVFVAHNVNFDYNVVRNEFKNIGIDFSRKKLCTVRLSRKLYPGLRSYSLGKLCSYLDIPLFNRHRAKGDTDATVILFEKLLEKDENNEIKKQLKGKNNEASLPALLSKETYDALPEKPGVYYFKDINGQIIYVGKAINIKKRVLSHFYDKKAKEVSLCRETSHIDFEESGSELVALLMESAAIKHHFPKFNRAQKLTNKGFGIVAYKNRKGIIQLAFNKLSLVSNPLAVFYSVNECTSFLEDLAERFDLCPKYTQLIPVGSATGRCNHYKLSNCKGICESKESIEEYNSRVNAAIESLTIRNQSFAIITKGKTIKEKAIVLVEEGLYKGYGFIENDTAVTSFEEFKNFISLQKNNSDVIRIVEQYLLQNENAEVVYA
ncbi:exonuclease domain-containing protein [Galbibacter mesophilus]|uniref:exonuclease domain-containing protein n=1 Tax=Galbibacter mesophilus TaxID=379069 RepID=UPI00191F07B6|nr:exonuclease domain-containing protein [Galbibacter mesophilus]MCM5661845.1 exonuclease domain-containing protein [Galbibacter mesophilus]